MKVCEGCVVTVAYEISDELGEILETSEISGPITFLHGSSRIIPGLDKRLLGMQKGETGVFEFSPEEAFGAIDDAATRVLSRSEFPAGDLVANTEFEAKIDGGDQSVLLRIVDASDDVVTVKIIHALAGQRIGMSVELLAVRAATSSEKAAGRAILKPPPPPPTKG